MRNICIAAPMAVALLVIGTVDPQPAAAMTIGVAPAVLQSAMSGTDTVMKASCFRNGWRGWGNYTSCEKQVKKKRYKGMHKDK